MLGNGVAGGSLDVHHTAAPAGGAALDFIFHLLSLENRQLGGAPLPVDLGVLGAPACLLNVDPQLGTLVATAAGGLLVAAAAFPGDLVGVAVFTQAVAIDFLTGAFIAVAHELATGSNRFAELPQAGQSADRCLAPPSPARASGSLSPTGYYGLVCARSSAPSCRPLPAFLGLEASCRSDSLAERFDAQSLDPRRALVLGDRPWAVHVALAIVPAQHDVAGDDHAQLPHLGGDLDHDVERLAAFDRSLATAELPPLVLAPVGEFDLAGAQEGADPAGAVPGELRTRRPSSSPSSSASVTVEVRR